MICVLIKSFGSHRRPVAVPCTPGRRRKALTQADVPLPNNFNRSPPLKVAIAYPNKVPFDTLNTKVKWPLQPCRSFCQTQTVLSQERQQIGHITVVLIYLIMTATIFYPIGHKSFLSSNGLGLITQSKIDIQLLVSKDVISSNHID